MADRRTVTFDGQSYKVRSTKIDIPDFDSMNRMAVLAWLNRHTYPRGYSRARSPLEGMGEVLNLRSV
jgi:hypothetical protein